MSRFFHVLQSIVSKKTLSLSYSLACTNFKLRNEGSYLGIFWYLLSPLALFVTILFVRHSAFSYAAIPMYPIYLLIGLITLGYLNRVIVMSTDVFRNNSSFIKSIQIPLEVLVISSALHALMLHIFEVLIIIGLAMYMGIPFVHVLFYILVTLLFSVFLLGVAFLFASLGVFVTDIGNIWAVASQLLLFITPTFYVLNPSSVLYIVNLYNPLYYFMTITRDLLMTGSASAWLIQVTLVISVATLLLGLGVFSKHYRRFAEWV